ncbi:hypothetical protein [Pseudomonas sp. PS02288]|uniref:hypothetical protein n=1 Tax=Pseudomonas sp. PS02288 TaxID=2991443 RepID=UPI00249BE35A|nr:hypothetical protein [Pseudomonas sp. PS02288]
MQAQTPNGSGAEATTNTNFSLEAWEGLMRGRALPGDILDGQTLGNYLHRKFQALIDENERLKNALMGSN